MALGKCGILGDGWVQRELAWYSHEALDRYVTKKLPQSEVLFALSGSGLMCDQKAQSQGAKYIRDRASSHIRYQNEILRKEFARWGEVFPGIDPRILAKEEAEYEKADIVIVPSTFAYRSFLEKGVPESKLRKVPYGVNLRRFEKIADPAPESFDVLFVGQVSFRKGVPYLLEAFDRLQHPRKRLRFVGSIRPEMERYLKIFPPSDEVEFTGPLPQHVLKHIMSRSHVMVLPSIEEGHVYVQAQAMACGCPVVAILNTGAEDLFTDGKEGFIIAIRDPEAIAEKLQLIADSFERRQSMGEAALRRVAKLGGWADYGERMTEVFKCLFS